MSRRLAFSLSHWHSLLLLLAEFAGTVLLSTAIILLVVHGAKAAALQASHSSPPSPSSDPTAGDSESADRHLLRVFQMLGAISPVVVLKVTTLCAALVFSVCEVVDTIRSSWQGKSKKKLSDKEKD
ncbi:hypothetical protein C8F01DRAFT_1249366 [Mycena amicta]|nr:hypothetical protein C8F01DRAFT_1249366 [Mycena amicta]